MIRRMFLTALLAFGLVGASAWADQPGISDIEGTWYFMIHVDGLPPCECIQIDTFSSNGRIEGPANDRFSGDQRGTWTLTGPGEYSMVFLQNSIDKDGNAAGLFVIKSTLKIADRDNGAGKFTFQILSNSGAVIFNGTGTLKGVRIRS